MKKFYFEEESIVGACGVSHIFELGTADDYRFYGIPSVLPSSRYLEAGCGWVLIGFIDTPLMYDVYQEACRKYTLVYQSPVRKNSNSGNDFFFCIFDARK